MPKPLPLPFRRLALTAAIACFALTAPAGAPAATLANGDFELGSLSGWQLSDSNPGGTWVAYTGSVLSPPFEPEFPIAVPPPPQGSWAAMTAQGGPGRHILYQDVALEPYYAHQLSLTAYYTSEAPIVAQDNLDPGDPMEVEAAPNQQYRIDLMRPTAPLDSLAPGDVLATLFATKTGDPVSLAPASISADLTPFAGQTVRLRMAEVDNEGPFNAGVDAVSILSTPPSNAIRLGKVRFNRKNGTARMSVTVPGAGALTLAGRGLVRRSKTLTAATTAKLLVKAKGGKKKTLASVGRLKVKAKITFTPTGGIANVRSRKLTLKKRLR